MSREAHAKPAPYESFPRVSGDEPDSAITTILETLFSPRERG